MNQLQDNNDCSLPYLIADFLTVTYISNFPVADLGEGLGGGKKELTEGRKASRASKSTPTPPPHPKSRSGSTTVYSLSNAIVPKIRFVLQMYPVPPWILAFPTISPIETQNQVVEH